jgi:lipid A 3-O-deacylase
MGLRMRTIVVGAALGLAAQCWGGALAADVASAPVPDAALGYVSLIQEVRFGAYTHNPAHDEGAPVDLSVETLSSPLPLAVTSNPYVNWFITPKIALGAMVNTGGKTSYVFGGFNWRIPIWKMLFFEGEFGGAVNNSPEWHEPGRVDMGCTATFRESGGFGLQLNPNWDVIVNVEHISHASLCSKQNPGITNFGVRVGYKF